MQSYIVRIYRRTTEPEGDGELVGVVEDIRGAQQSFQGVEELARILEAGGVGRQNPAN